MNGDLARLRPVDRLLTRAEREIGLISRCRPRNAATEQHQLLTAWRSGRPRLPRWVYAGVPDLSALRWGLERCLDELRGDEPVSQLYSGRAEELHLETRLVEAVGRRELRALATERFQIGGEREGQEALELASRWCQLPVESASGWVTSDDREDPSSLVMSLSRVIGALRIPVRVEVSDELTALAATGDGFIVVARDRRLSLADVRRIVVHEVFGHALPRVVATRQGLGLHAVGSRAGNDEQEGYALFLERRNGVMNPGRQVELALRHHAALGVRQGADWVETTQQLLNHGADLESAAAIASRVHRACGLAREIVYLPALCRVTSAIDADSEVEGWLASGRLSLDAVGVLRQLPQFGLATHLHSRAAVMKH